STWFTPSHHRQMRVEREARMTPPVCLVETSGGQSPRLWSRWRVTLQSGRNDSSIPCTARADTACQLCGKTLVGRQLTWCSDRCRKRFEREAQRSLESEVASD